MRRKIKKESKTGKMILVNVGPVEKRVAITENGRLEDFYLEREGVEHYVGNIYKGKVSSIIPGIEAAFVDIGLDKNGFLHVSDVTDKNSVLKEILSDEEAPPVQASGRKKFPRIDEVLKVGQEMMVQVVKEGIGTKGPRITTFISIPGRYLVLTPFDSHIGISRRIKDRAIRKKVRDTIDKFKLPKGIGCIVRTMAEGLSEKELNEEMKYLLNLWKRVKTRAERQKAPVTVYEEYGAVLITLRDKFTNDIEQLIVDSKEEYSRIIKFLKAFRPELNKKVKVYTGQAQLFHKYDLEKQLDAIVERKVSLKSGGYIVIDQTEGLIAIDVNTGRFKGKDNLEATAYKTNLEAAKTIPRQLILRDIGGIVIIDFIDMDQRKHRESVYNVLRQEMRQDKARISLRSISQFGIVEMTRQRMRKSLESTSHIECPYCEGKGIIKSAKTTAIETARKIEKALSAMSGRIKSITVVTHPDINVTLMSNQAKMLSEIQRKYRCRIELREDLHLHREDVVIEKN